MGKPFSGLESTTMRKIKTIREDEMIAAFLYAEL